MLYKLNPYIFNVKKGHVMSEERIERDADITCYPLENFTNKRLENKEWSMSILVLEL